jgi:hypothetical protein
MEAQKCKQRRINDIGFFDPTSINEATVGFRSTVDAMCDALIDMQDKKWILLPYNHQYVYPNSYIFLFNNHKSNLHNNHKSNLHIGRSKCSNHYILIGINLDKSKIRILDSKRLSHDLIQPCSNMLNKSTKIINLSLL